MNEDMNGIPNDPNEVTVDELEDSLTAGEAQDEQDGADGEDETVARVREGIAELFEDGWTAEELAAFSQDEEARRAVRRGHSVARAACAYLRAALEGRAGRRRGVPTVRRAAADAGDEGNRIENMTDEQFDAFSRRAKDAMMAGRRVRI